MTNHRSAGALAGLAFGSVLLLSACGPSRTAIYVRTPPPPPIAERVLVAPGPDYIWIAGYQSWSGNSYVWVPGRWERRPGRHHNWVPGHWVNSRHGWYWVEGHWR